MWIKINPNDPSSYPPMAPEGTIDWEIGRTISVLVLTTYKDHRPRICIGFYQRDEEEDSFSDWVECGRDGYSIDGHVVAWQPLPEIPGWAFRTTT